MSHSTSPHDAGTQHISSASQFQEFLKLGQQYDAPVIVKFTATWCGPCKFIAPHFDTYAKKLADKAYFVSVDIDKIPELAKLYRVTNIPNFTVIKNQKVSNVWLGGDVRLLDKNVAAAIAQQESSTASKEINTRSS